MRSREEITEKYLFLALDELSKHRGAIKKGRTLEKMWRKELIAFDVFSDAAKSQKQQLKLFKK